MGGGRSEVALAEAEGREKLEDAADAARQGAGGGDR
jgi:hypothetical protein